MPKSHGWESNPLMSEALATPIRLVPYPCVMG